MLSILDEMENIFIWQHLQVYESQAKGVWLGMSFNPKGKSSRIERLLYSLALRQLW